MQAYDCAKNSEAWTAFWNCPGGGFQCVSGSPGITQALNDHWSSFAMSLSSGTRVLDIGCGAGAAARALLAARRDVRITGIDLAAVPSLAEARIELISNTPVESLPFPDATFGAAVSQFGFEYSQKDRASRELARVLAPESRFAFLVHHAGSSIVAANRTRLNALAEFQEREMRTAFLSGNTLAFNGRMSLLMEKHPRDSLIVELARCLPLRIRLCRDQRMAVWKAVEAALAPERRILETLNMCCLAPEDLDGFLGSLRNFFEVRSISALHKPNAEPIAWRLGGARR
jgi:ubiquinone/menaquinone biosynthesis C-methylase UbiE